MEYIESSCGLILYRFDANAKCNLNYTYIGNLRPSIEII